MKKTCRKCLIVRTAMVAAVLGGVGGYWVASLGAGAKVSMLVTFFGAFIPIVWFVKQHGRDDGKK